MITLLGPGQFNMHAIALFAQLDFNNVFDNGLGIGVIALASLGLWWYASNILKPAHDRQMKFTDKIEECMDLQGKDITHVKGRVDDTHLIVLDLKTKHEELWRKCPGGHPRE